MYLPSPQRIAEETASIRNGWSRSEFLKRKVGNGRTSGPRIKVVSTDYVSDYIGNMRESAEGWQYLTEEEAKARSRPHKKVEEPKTVPWDEMLERELYQVVCICFGD